VFCCSYRKNMSPNSARLSSGGLLGEQEAEIGIGSGAEREADLLREAASDSGVREHFPGTAWPLTPMMCLQLCVFNRLGTAWPLALVILLRLRGCKRLDTARPTVSMMISHRVVHQIRERGRWPRSTRGFF
jgi:hypothetical protein